jgi:hypothetical protein
MNRHYCDEVCLTTVDLPVVIGSPPSQYPGNLFRRISIFLSAQFFCALVSIGASLLLFSSRAGYLHAQGVTSLDNNNQPIILRGVNLGSWLRLEFYMMGNPSLPNYANAGTGTVITSNNSSRAIIQPGDRNMFFQLGAP